MCTRVYYTYTYIREIWFSNHQGCYRRIHIRLHELRGLHLLMLTLLFGAREANMEEGERE